MTSIGKDLFLMFCDSTKPFAPGELQKLLGECYADQPALPLTDADIDGLCHSFSGRPVFLPTCAPKLIADEWANLERLRQRENHGTCHEL